MSRTQRMKAAERIDYYSGEIIWDIPKREKTELEKGIYAAVIYYNLAFYAVMGVLWLAISI